MIRIGIRHEDKYLAERRTPLVPAHVGKLVKELGIEVLVQESPKRVFTEEEYVAEGAKIVPDMQACDIVFGVKEIPEKWFIPGQTYVFFSHVIKGQPYNMPMLRQMMESGCNLIDYERVVDDFNRRLIFFGRFAGLAGAINTLWTTGLRLKHLGFDTPFLHIQQAHNYKNLQDAREAVSKAGFEIAKYGLPTELTPFTIGITGYGNVSNGVQEILSLLPVQEIHPGDLHELSGKIDHNKLLYRVTFREEHISAHNQTGKLFDLDDYYVHPENYHSIFEQYLPQLSVLINGMYWDERYPRILTRAYMKENFMPGMNPKLKVVGDITCDPNGSVEATLKGTYIEDPIFVYHPESHSLTSGYEGDGLQVMAVDILPSELPRDSSLAFSSVLRNFVKSLADANFKAGHPDAIGLPAPLRKALILHNGRLTPEYAYIQNYLK
jgi:alpha-aminoadipic semialdehyde synthase